MYPFWVYVVLYCFLNREAEGRQVADLYGIQTVLTARFNGLLSKPPGCGRLVSAPTDSECLTVYLFNQISIKTIS